MDTTVWKRGRHDGSRLLLTLAAVSLLAACDAAAAPATLTAVESQSTQVISAEVPTTPAPLAPVTPVERPSPTPVGAPAPPPTSGLPPHVRVVTRGDTLWGIAREHHLPLRVILAANPEIRNPSLIHPGDRIEIPAATVLADFRVTPGGGTRPIGRVRTTMVIPTDWAEVPGTFRFDGIGAASPRTTRGVAERMGYWFDPVTLDPESGGARVAYVTGHECQYWASTAPTCRDVDWIFVDAVNPAWPDSLAWCTWVDGIRPAELSEPCDPANVASGNQRWFTATGGSLQIIVN